MRRKYTLPACILCCFLFFHGGWFWYAGWVFGCGYILMFFFGFVVLCFSVVLLCVREDNVSSFSHGRLL